MKSPLASVDYTKGEETDHPPPPFVRRGFRETDKPSSTALSSHDEPFGVVARLPLGVQVAFRRKLVAIIALQLGVVSLGVAVLEFTAARDHWLESSVLGLGLAVVALLLVLHFVRDKHPLNWIALALLTGVLIGCLAALDTTLDSHIVLINCVFTWLFSTVLLLTAAWTREKYSHHICGLRFDWTLPVSLDPHDHEDRSLASPLLTGGVAYLVAWGVFALVRAVGLDLATTYDEIIISLVVQLVLGGWLLYQIASTTHKKTPDAYMSGVIYLYADVLALLAVAVVGFLCMAVCAEGSAGGAALCADCYPWIGSTDDQRQQDENEQV